MSGLRTRVIGRLRRVFGHPRLLPITALILRARTVRPSTLFVLRELLGRSEQRAYRLPGRGLWVIVRHGTGDVVTLGEVFHDHDYVPIPQVREHLRDVRRIVDLGANIGLFGVFAAARWPDAHITGYEPDPANAHVQSRTIALNQLGSRWTLIEAAAGAADGEVRLVAGQAALSHIADHSAAEAISVPIHDVVSELAKTDLVKMDIEGGEWPILSDPRFRLRPPPVLVLEYHPRLCPGPDPHREVRAALEAADLKFAPVKHHDNAHGMLWAWRA